EITGHPIPTIMGERRAGDPAELVADNRLAKKLLDWTPKYDSVDAIVETAWKWHQSHPNGFAS
ncbi:UDP-glucose 4-epimerase GalE, partial [Rubripirellula sp.]|nr:UDP-glucose 4-epimerase GalE [Rubripirellula sp.]